MVHLGCVWNPTRYASGVGRSCSQVVLRRWQHGQSVQEIATALGVAARTVRHLIRRFGQGTTDRDAVSPAYGRCGWRRPWRNQLLWQNALEMRRQHPAWGAGLIRVLLEK